jgi:hypothetical protein
VPLLSDVAAAPGVGGGGTFGTVGAIGLGGAGTVWPEPGGRSSTKWLAGIVLRLRGPLTRPGSLSTSALGLPARAVLGSSSSSGSDAGVGEGGVGSRGTSLGTAEAPETIAASATGACVGCGASVGTPSVRTVEEIDASTGPVGGPCRGVLIGEPGAGTGGVPLRDAMPGATGVAKLEGGSSETIGIAGIVFERRVVGDSIGPSAGRGGSTSVRGGSMDSSGDSEASGTASEGAVTARTGTGSAGAVTVRVCHGPSIGGCPSMGSPALDGISVRTRLAVPSSCSTSSMLMRVDD